MADSEHVQLLKKGRDAVREWQEERLVGARLDLAGADTGCFGWDGQLDIAWTRTLKPGTFTIAAARAPGRGYHDHKAADW